MLLDDRQRRRSTVLQVPRSPSGGSNSSLTSSANSMQTEDSSLVRIANFFTGVNLKD